MGHVNSNKTTYRIAGAILAGGKSRRMGGFPKGTLQVKDRLSMVEHLAQQMADAGIEGTVIVANTKGVYGHVGCEVIPDRRTGFGPLAGVEAALFHFAETCDAVLCLPCDMPALSSREILVLLETFSRTRAKVVFAETDNKQSHPLCAIISSYALADISTALDLGILRVSDLWLRLRGRSVYFDNLDAFINLNTLADLRQWRCKYSIWTKAV